MAIKATGNDVNAQFAAVERARRTGQPVPTKAPKTKEADAPLVVPQKGWKDLGERYKRFQGPMHNAGYYEKSKAGDEKSYKKEVDGLGGHRSAEATRGVQRDLIAAGILDKTYVPSGSMDRETMSALDRLKTSGFKPPDTMDKDAQVRLTRLGAAMREKPGFLSEAAMTKALEKPAPLAGSGAPTTNTNAAATGAAAQPEKLEPPKNSLEALGNVNKIYDNLQKNVLTQLQGDGRERLANELAQGQTSREVAEPSAEAQKVRQAVADANKQIDALPEKDRDGMRKLLDDNLSKGSFPQVKQMLEAMKKGEVADAARADPKNIAQQQYHDVRDNVASELKGMEEMLKTAPGGAKYVLDELKKGNLDKPGTSVQAQQVKNTMDRINAQINSLPEADRDYARKSFVDNPLVNRTNPLTHQALTALKQGNSADTQRAETAQATAAAEAQQKASTQRQYEASRDLNGTFQSFEKTLAPIAQNQKMFDELNKRLGRPSAPWRDGPPQGVVDSVRGFTDQVNKRLDGLSAPERKAVLEGLAKQFPNAGRIFSSFDAQQRSEEMMRQGIEGLVFGGGA